MQDNDNKVWSKRLHFGATSQTTAIADLKQEVANALILNPDTPTSQLAEQLVRETIESLQTTLFPVLLHRFYTAMIGQQRKAANRANKAQSALPGFEHLPSNIPTREGETIALVDANYRRLRDYYRALIRPYTRKLRNDPKILEVKALMARVRKYAEKEQGITVRQVFLLEAL